MYKSANGILLVRKHAQKSLFLDQNNLEMSKPIVTPLQARVKLEHFCAYQERCHVEVAEKLRSLGVEQPVADDIIVHLINSGFLNEERFAKSFARGKHRIKFWGKVRITAELKARGISSYNISAALSELDPEEYVQQFETIAHRSWEAMREPDIARKKKKIYDYLLRKGFENQMIYDKLKLLSKS